MDRITRKSLKDDRFAAEVTHSVEYLAGHRRQTVLYGGIAFGILAVALGVFLYLRHRSNAAHEALSKALFTSEAPISDTPTPGSTSFKSEKERGEAARKEFQSLIDRFPRSDEAKIARYYVGLLHFGDDNKAEAQKHLEQAIEKGHDELLALARLTLADIYVLQGKDDQARKQWDFLIKNPTNTVSEARAQLAKARYLRHKNPEEARKVLLELIKRPGAVSGAAGALLRDLGQQ